MKAQVNYKGQDYKSDKSYGMAESESLFVCNISVTSIRNQYKLIAKTGRKSDKGIRLKFKFPRLTQGITENSKVESVTLSFSLDEAEELNAILHSFLHHPKYKESSEEWITYRGMDFTSDDVLFSQLTWFLDTENFTQSITIENKSCFHFFTLKIFIEFFVKGDFDEDTGQFEMDGYTFEGEIKLNLAPNETQTISLQDIPYGANITKINVISGYGCKSYLESNFD